MMRFAHPQMLWLLAVVPLFLAWAWREAGRPRRLLGDGRPGGALERLLPGWSRGRALAKGLLTAAGLALWILAAAGPQLGTRQVEVKRQGVDVVVAVDVSQSMAAQDLAPDRMARARHSIRRLLEKLEGDRVALLPFSGAAFLQHPLTSDYALSGVFTDLLEPGLIPQAGTDLGAAIRRAVATYQETAPGQRVLIILSDGEDFEDGWREALAEAREAGVVIHTVGMGTPEGAPVPDPQRPGSYKLDRAGSVVFSRLNEAVLQELASQGGGSYQRSTPGGEELTGILERIGELEGRELGSRRYAGWEERFPLFLAPGLLLVLAAWAWPARRRAGGAGTLALVLGLLVAPQVRADHVTRNNQGLRAYNKGDYGAATEQFGQSLGQRETAQARHNLGTALFRGGDLEGAAAQFRAAAALAQTQGDRGLAARSWANLGRTLLDQEQLDPAIQALEEALLRRPDLAEARHNLELALRLKQQQQQQQSQDPQKQDQQKQDPQDKDQQKQDQQKQDPQQAQGGQGEGDPAAERPEGGEPRPEQRIDPAQLQQLLNAVEAQERQAQERQLQRKPATPRRVEKDW